MENIATLTEGAVRDTLTFDLAGEFDKDRFTAQVLKANTGMRFERDRQTHERIGAGHIMRAVQMVTQDPVERARYLRASMPKLIPASAKK